MSNLANLIGVKEIKHLGSAHTWICSGKHYDCTSPSGQSAREPYAYTVTCDYLAVRLVLTIIFRKKCHELIVTGVVSIESISE